MAALTLLHPSASSEWPIQVNFWLTAEPQGAEDKQIRDNAQNAVDHWRSRAEYLLAHGIIDMVVKRGELKATLARIIGLLRVKELPAAA